MSKILATWREFLQTEESELPALEGQTPSNICLLNFWGPKVNKFLSPICLLKTSLACGGKGL